MSPARTTLGALLLSGCLALAIVGCGADSGAPEAAAAASGLKGEPVLFGHASAYTKQAAFLGPAMRSGIDLAIDEINGHGGVMGRPVELRVADTEGSEQVAVTAISKLVEVDGVAALVGPTSMEIFAVIDMLKEKKVPTALVAGAAELDDKMGGKTMWRLFPSDSIFAPVIASYARAQQVSPAGMLFEDQESAQNLKKSIIAAYRGPAGQIGTEVDPALGQSNYRAETVKAFHKPLPKAFFYQMSPGVASVFWQNAVSTTPNLGDVTVIGNDTLLDDESLKAFGPALGQIKLKALSPVAAGIGDKHFRERYADKYDKPTPDQYSANTYDATLVYALAAIAAKDPSRKGIASKVDAVGGPPGKACATFAECVNLLRKGREINYEGASGSLDFDVKGNVPGAFGVFDYRDGKMRQTSILRESDIDVTPAAR